MNQEQVHLLSERIKEAMFYAHITDMTARDVYGVALIALERHIKDLSDAKAVAKILRAHASMLIEHWLPVQED